MINFILKILGNTYIMAFVSCFGVFVTVYTVFKAWRFRRISYRRCNILLCGNGISFNNIQVKIKEKKKKNINIARYAIWNSGTKYINDFDLAKAAPLCLEGKNATKVFGARIVDVTDPTNDFRCYMQDDRKVVIDFDYMNKGDGLVIEILYSGNIDDIVFTGRIKGGKIKPSYSVVETFSKWQWIYNIITSKIVSFIVIAFAFVFCPIAYLQSANYVAIPNNFFEIEDGILSRIADGFMILCLIAFSGCVSIPFIMRLFRPRLPKKLKSSFQYIQR